MGARQSVKRCQAWASFFRFLSSSVDPARPLGEEIAERTNVRAVGANDAVIEPELAEQLQARVALASHMGRIVVAYLAARRIEQQGLTAFEVFERCQPHV